MNRNSTYTKELVLAGLLLALGIILPLIFHRIPGNTGQVLLPMHIPILIGGFVLRPSFAVLLAIITPLLNSALTGMPPLFPVALTMSVELAVYALLISLMKRHTNLSNILILIISLIVGRFIAGLFNYIFAILFNLDIVSPITWALGAILTGIPGIIIQIVLVPIVVDLIEKYYYRKSE